MKLEVSIPTLIQLARLY